MKAIPTLIFVLFIGTAVHAKAVNPEVKVATITRGVTVDYRPEVAFKDKDSVARVYLFKNSRIKKELSFGTKRDKSKLA